MIRYKKRGEDNAPPLLQNPKPCIEVNKKFLVEQFVKPAG